MVFLPIFFLTAAVFFGCLENKTGRTKMAKRAQPELTISNIANLDTDDVSITLTITGGQEADMNASITLDITCGDVETVTGRTAQAVAGTATFTAISLADVAVGTECVINARAKFADEEKETTTEAVMIKV